MMHWIEKTVEDVVREIIENISSQFDFFREKEVDKKEAIKVENKFDVVPDIIPSTRNSTESLERSSSDSLKIISFR